MVLLLDVALIYTTGIYPCYNQLINISKNIMVLLEISLLYILPEYARVQIYL